MGNLVGLCVTALVLGAGCQKGQESGAKQEQPSGGAAQAPAAQKGGAGGTTVLNVATATTGGAYYPIGNAIAQLWNEKVPGVRASAQATNGTPHNLQLMSKGEAEVAIGQAGVIYEAVNGVGNYEKQGKQTYFRGMTHLYPNVMHWVVRKDVPAKTLADLKGKRVVPGPQNSATEINSREMLSIVPLDYRTKGDLKADYMDYNQAAEQLKNRQADAINIAGGVPTAAVIDVMTAGEGRLLSLSDDYIQKLVAKYPWYFPFTIPANTYRGQDQDVKTVAVANILVCKADLPDQLVHDLVATMYENAGTLAAAHAAMKAFKLDDALKGIKGVVELHPGAAQFFKEKGLAP